MGASVHATDVNGYTALLFVAQSRVAGRHFEVARLLLDKVCVCVCPPVSMYHIWRRFISLTCARQVGTH